MRRSTNRRRAWPPGRLWCCTTARGCAARRRSPRRCERCAPDRCRHRYRLTPRRRTAARPMALVVDALPELPHVPELPARGPWADMVGRAVSRARRRADRVGREPLAGDGSRAGRDTRRARALLSEDLDAVEDRLQGYAGPAKLQMCGPLTLAAVLELRGGEAAVSDPVATADLAASLAEGLAAHLDDLRRRVPRRRVGRPGRRASAAARSRPERSRGRAGGAPSQRSRRPTPCGSLVGSDRCGRADRARRRRAQLRDARRTGLC